MSETVHIDLVICTHNRSAGLDRVLRALTVQRPCADASWSVLVVDNASTDDTPGVAAAYAQELDLRYVHEATLGLTNARRRGFAETSGEWIAFVDDDNLLDRGWIEAIGAAIGAHPEAGGIGGKVVLNWEVPPPADAGDFGFCFAEQDLGDHPLQVNSLVGAGMVLKREALHACGWASKPLLSDRVGKRLVSGGDVEMAIRVRGAGYALRYAPKATMRHLMPASRATPMYLLRINRSLGATSALVSLLNWSGDRRGWRRSVMGNHRRRMREALAGLWWSLRSGRRHLSALAWMAYAIGYREGIAHVGRLTSRELDELMGAASRSGPTTPASALAPGPNTAARAGGGQTSQ